MPATLIGTVGIHGIAADETGMVIQSLDDDSRMETNYLKNRIGERVGRSDYDESIEIEIKGKITAATPWTQKLSSVLTMTNTIAANHLVSVLTGKTLINNVKRSRVNDDWNEISVSAEMLPFFPA
jgi:hypothetical protein